MAALEAVSSAVATVAQAIDAVIGDIQVLTSLSKSIKVSCSSIVAGSSVASLVRNSVNCFFFYFNLNFDWNGFSHCNLILLGLNAGSLCDGILVGGDLNVLVLVPGIVIGVEGARVLLILEGVSLDRVEGLTPASIFVFSMD